MTMEIQPFEDVNMLMFHCHVCFGGYNPFETQIMSGTG